MQSQASAAQITTLSCDQGMYTNTFITLSNSLQLQWNLDPRQSKPLTYPDKLAASIAEGRITYPLRSRDWRCRRGVQARSRDRVIWRGPVKYRVFQKKYPPTWPAGHVTSLHGMQPFLPRAMWPGGREIGTTLVDKNITDKNRTLGPLACTFLSVFFLSVHILSVFRMGPKFFQIFAPSLIKTVDYYKVLLLMFIGIWCIDKSKNPFG